MTPHKYVPYQVNNEICELCAKEIFEACGECITTKRLYVCKECHEDNALFAKVIDLDRIKK